jgi:tetratricopeptide (TPR) repeat protein
LSANHFFKVFRMTRIFIVAVPVIFLCSNIFGDDGQHHHDHGELGSVHFPVSCSTEARKTFGDAIAMLHSFWYDEAEKTFSEVTRMDPGCAMGYWGIAMSLYHPIWAPPNASDLRNGTAAIEKAKSIGARTQRERDYIAALEVYYKDSDRVPHQERARAWREATERLAARYPQDREAAIFFALALTARSGDPAAARIETEKLGSVRKALEHADGNYDWGTQVEIQRLAASAWVAHAEGNNELAVRLMRSAAELEDTTEKHPVTPGAVLPARELLGDLFLELDQPARALPEFETTLRNLPKRFNAISGAARAAELSGDRKKAKQRYTELIELCAGADSARLELQNARAFLKR